MIGKKKKKKADFFSTHHLVHHLALFIKNNEQSNKRKDNDYSNIAKKGSIFWSCQFARLKNGLLENHDNNNKFLRHSPCTIRQENDPDCSARAVVWDQLVPDSFFTFTWNSKSKTSANLLWSQEIIVPGHGFVCPKEEVFKFQVPILLSK